jgi:transposase
MATYFIDLRQKILPAYERRLSSQRALADLFGVSLSFVEPLLRRHRTTGDIAPKLHAGGQRPSLDAAATTLVQQGVQANSEITFKALCTRVVEERGIHVSVATMCRVLQRLGLPRKNVAPCQRARHPAHPAGAPRLPPAPHGTRPSALEVRR